MWCAQNRLQRFDRRAAQEHHRRNDCIAMAPTTALPGASIFLVFLADWDVVTSEMSVTKDRHLAVELDPEELP